ncbi:MAG TPA: tetratricopeptide repeat protein, partial [Nitrosomonas sp.]|nr:tetratricopeptide repeat protein [Nitrosomonas sp.]
MAKKKNKQKPQPRQSPKSKGINWKLVSQAMVGLLAFIGSLASVNDLVDKIRSDGRTFLSFVIPGLVVVTLLIVVVQLFRNKSLFAIPLLTVVIVGGVFGGLGWRLYNQTEEDKIIVLVAQFDGPEETYGLHNQIMEDLRHATKVYDDTVILESKEVVTAGQGSAYARELGQKAKADLVIWAWYRPTENPNITIHFEKISAVEVLAIEESETYKPKATLAQLESFEVQREIGSETSTLVTFISGMIRLASGDHEQAVKRFEQILEDEDNSTFVSRSDLLFILGNSYSSLENYELAIRTFTASIESDPLNAAAYVNRGASYIDLGEYERSLQDFDKAIEIDSQNIYAYVNRGAAYSYLKQYELSILDFNKAFEIDPLFAGIFYNRGLNYLYLENYELALLD